MILHAYMASERGMKRDTTLRAVLSLEKWIIPRIAAWNASSNGLSMICTYGSETVVRTVFRTTPFTRRQTIPCMRSHNDLIFISCNIRATFLNKKMREKATEEAQNKNKINPWRKIRKSKKVRHKKISMNSAAVANVGIGASSAKKSGHGMTSRPVRVPCSPVSYRRGATGKLCHCKSCLYASHLPHPID